MDHGEVLNLIPEAVEEGEDGLGLAILLGLFKFLLGDLFGEDGGGLGALEDTVLAECEERLEEVVAYGEADDELLPRE